LAHNESSPAQNDFRADADLKSIPNKIRVGVAIFLSRA
jgi:hypothetical protein